MDWNDVRHFLALARHGSVRAAGAALGVSHSTVARRVEALEERLAARLFDRARDGYTLTQAGHQMMPGAERVESEMLALERGLAGQDERLSGVVSVTCCDNYVAEIVLTALTTFCASYPEIELQLNTDSRAFDLSKREADIAIRTLGLDATPPEHLIGMKLAPVTLANYVAREHAGRLEPGRDGASPRWVSFEERSYLQARIAGSSYPGTPVWGCFSSLELLVHAAKLGLGLVVLPTYVGDRDPALRRLSSPDLSHVADLWILSHPDLRSNVRLKATRAHVAAGLRRHVDLFRGEAWSRDETGRHEIGPSDT